MRLLALLLLAALPLAAWAGWARLEAPGDKLHFDAYSIQAPLERGWLVNRGGPHDVGFGAMRSRTHTWSLTAAAIALPSGVTDAARLLVHVKAQFLAGSDPVRFRILESRESVETLRGAACARTYYKAEDRLAGGGPVAYYVIEATQVTCVHPDAPGLAIELGYHERYVPGEKTPAEQGRAIAAFGERFIRSVKFWRPVEGAFASVGR